MSKHEDLLRAVWRKASYSNGNGGCCVEVAALDSGHRAVRDSKDPAGPLLRFAPGAWRAFTTSVREGRFQAKFD